MPADGGGRAPVRAIPTGAVQNMYAYEGYAPNASAAAAAALRAGVDVECGAVFHRHMEDAVREGLASEADVDASLRRSFRLLFRAGLFDPQHRQPYLRIPFAAINATAHWA
eukprot:gene9204-6216_t